MKDRLEKIAPFFPWLGLVFMAAGLIVWLVTRTFDLIPNALIITGIVLLVLFAIMRPHDIKELVGARSVRYGTSSVLAVLFLAVICGLLYWLALQNDDWRVDVTETGAFTALPETVELLDSLDEPIHVIGFYSARTSFQQPQAESLLENLTSVSDKLTYEFKDPELVPFEAQQYDLNFDGTLVFIKGSGENEVFAKASSATEQEIHKALLQVANPVEKKLYLLTGHGEYNKDDFDEIGIAQAIASVEDLGFEVETLNLLSTENIPDDATVVAILNQEIPLQPEEVNAIQAYLESGGAMLIARDSIDSQGVPIEEMDNLNTILLDSWGVQWRNDLIVDPARALVGIPNGLAFVSLEYGNSPIITSDIQRFGLVFQLARSVTTESRDNVVHTNLILTSDTAWGETNISGLINENVLEPNSEDIQGQLTVATVSENLSTGARLIVFGDTDFVTNFYNNQYSGVGVRLFGNTLNWLADDEVSINLAAREQITRTVNVPQGQLSLLLLVSVCLAPGLMMVIGFTVWQSRRNRR